MHVCQARQYFVGNLTHKLSGATLNIIGREHAFENHRLYGNDDANEAKTIASINDKAVNRENLQRARILIHMRETKMPSNENKLTQTMS